MRPARSRLARNRLTPALLLGCALALAPACTERVRRSLAELGALREAISEEFGVPEVTVMTNSTAVFVTLINSRFNGLGEAEMAKKGHEVALFTKKRYPRAAEHEIIVVAFAVSKTYLGFFRTGDVLASYPFQVAGLGVVDPMTGLRVSAVAATQSFNERQNQTTVMVNHLRLRGDLEDGLIMLPTFTVPGGKVSEPQWVELEFGSFSRGEVFTRDRRIEIRVDGERLLRGDARLVSSGKSSAGQVTEFVSQRISYKQFLRLAEGREVRIRLAGAEVELTPDHLEALRSVKRCVDNSKCG